MSSLIFLPLAVSEELKQTDRIAFYLLDNAFSEVISGIGLSDYSDHLAVFAITPASYKCNKPNKRIIWDMRNFNQDHFLNDLYQYFNKNLAQDDDDRKAYFSNFCNLFKQTIHKHAI